MDPGDGTGRLLPTTVRGNALQAARVTVYAGAGAAVAGAFMVGVLAGQAVFARRTIPRAEAPPPRGDGRYGTGHGGRPVHLLVLGDSTAAGYGVTKPRQTPGALLAAGLAARLRRPVHLRTMAVVGATSAMLAPQVEAAVELLSDRPAGARGVARPGEHIAVIVIGGNDVTHRIPPATAVGHLASAVRTLRGAGARVMVATCPDLGTIRPIPPPLRWLASRWSREMAAAQTVAVVEAGGVTVSLGDLLGPRFAAAPHLMFGHDRFHPSAQGYGAAAAAMLPTVVALLRGEEAAVTGPGRDQDVRSLPQAAVEAAGSAGAEVAGARIGGRERGPAGRWVRLRHRVREVIWPADPGTEGSAVPSAGARPVAAPTLPVGEAP